MTDSDKFLEHYGIRGMQWGVRKSEGGGSSGGSATTPKKPTVPKTNSRERTRYKTAPKKLTSEELQRRITRLEREKRYNDLNTRDLLPGEKAAKDILAQNGKQILATVAVGAGVFVVKKAIDKAFGEGTADKIYKPGKKK